MVHPNCNGWIKTGSWQWDDLDSVPSRWPTHHFRDRAASGRNLPDTAAWSFAICLDPGQCGYSTAAGYGLPFAANVVEPPTIPADRGEEMEARLAAARADPAARGGGQGHYRFAPAQPAAQTASAETGLSRARPRLAPRADRARNRVKGTTSHEPFHRLAVDS